MKRLGATWVGWSAVLLTLAFAIGLAGARQGALLNLGFTPLCVVIAAILYRSYPRQFVFYAFSLWMFTPLVRRLADWQSVYHPASMVMLAPLLVAGLGGVTVARRLGRLGDPDIAPFTILLALLGFGFFVGLLQNGPSQAALGLLNWGAPLLFGMHLLLRHRSAEEFEGALFDSLAWGVLGMSLYGIYQYFSPPPWDVAWMLNAEMASIGLPLPRMVRVFSTMNSPGPFAGTLAVGLLAVLVRGGVMRWAASAPGYVALLLSLVRAAWGGWAIGALALLATATPGRSVRYLVLGAGVVALAVPLLLVEPVSTVVSQRVNTLGAADQDVSLRARTELYRTGLTMAASPFGSGLGASGTATKMSEETVSFAQAGVVDSGLIELLMNLGGPSTLVFVIVLVVLMVQAGLRARRHPHSGLGFAAATTIFVQIAFGPMLSGVLGAVFYTFLCLALSPRAAAVAARDEARAQAREALAAQRRLRRAH